MTSWNNSCIISGRIDTTKGRCSCIGLSGSFWFLQANLFDECCPLLRVAGQQFFVLHILLMDDRVSVVLRIPRAVLLAHFQGIENVDAVGPSQWSGSGVIMSE